MKITHAHTQQHQHTHTQFKSHNLLIVYLNDCVVANVYT